MASFPSIFKPNIRQVPLSSPADTQLSLLKTVPFKQKIWISKLRRVSMEEAEEAGWNITNKRNIFGLGNRRKSSQIINEEQCFLFYLFFYFMTSEASLEKCTDRDRSRHLLVHAESLNRKYMYCI